jgi:ribose transport system substrate-binding protein
LNGLQEVIGAIPADLMTTVDSGNISAISEENVLKLLRELSDRHQIGVICFNDDAALGALAAARRLGREEDVAIVGQGADRRMREEIRKPNSRIVGSTAYMPDRYGEKLIELALKILQHEPVPPAVYIDHVFINAHNIHLFYGEA